MERVGGYIEFEPYSAVIIQLLKSARTARERNTVFETVFCHPYMSVIEGTNGLVRVSAGHRTNGNWRRALEMARSLALRGIPTAFLPEHETETSADAISRINGHWRIVDFKYCETTRWNTIQAELRKAFLQGEGAVIQFTNADAGQFREAIKYLQRKNVPVRDMIIMNKYGRFLELRPIDFESNKYIKKIKGLL